MPEDSAEEVFRGEDGEKITVSLDGENLGEGGAAVAKAAVTVQDGPFKGQQTVL